MDRFEVVVSYDAETKLWLVDSSTIPGLNVEARTFEELVSIVQDAAPELIDKNVGYVGDDLSSIPLAFLHQVTARRLHHA